MDYIYYGKYFKHYLYPSPLPSDEIIKTFKDDLIVIIPSKLSELLSKCQILKEQKNIGLQAVANVTKKGSFDEYFCTSLIFYEFSEYYVIQKWLNYWLLLWNNANNKPLSTKITNNLNFVEQDDILRAKQVPLEDLFEGRLRKVGSRFVGLCPFHEEKTPSFTIYTNNNSYFCFGCNQSGDAITFIQKLKKLTFPEAVRYLL